MTIKVIYDVQVLGLANQHELARTGVSRVVDYVARGIASDGLCEVQFANLGSTALQQDCSEYLSKVSDLSDYNLLANLAVHNFNETRSILNLNKLMGSPVYAIRGSAQRLNNLFHEMVSRRIAAGIAKVDIYHSPFDPLPDWIKPITSNPVRFLTIYDMIPLLHPEWFETPSGNHVASLFQRIIDSLRPTDFVHCISHSTRNDLLNALPLLEPDRVFVASLAADSSVFYCGVPELRIEEVRKKYQIPDGKYILSVCTLEPRKNVESVVKAFGQVVTQQRIEGLSLVLVGARGWATKKIDQAIGDATGYRDRVLVTGYVPDEDLAPLYNGATAFIYPSRYEGFGLPPLEAMSCGIPVITSDTSSLPEVVGDAGMMVSPDDLDGLCQCILSVTQDNALKEKLGASALARAASFSWRRCTDEIVSNYHRSLGRTPALKES